MAMKALFARLVGDGDKRGVVVVIMAFVGVIDGWRVMVGDPNGFGGAPTAESGGLGLAKASDVGGSASSGQADSKPKIQPGYCKETRWKIG